MGKKKEKMEKMEMRWKPTTEIRNAAELAVTPDHGNDGDNDDEDDDGSVDDDDDEKGDASVNLVLELHIWD